MGGLESLEVWDVFCDYLGMLIRDNEWGATTAELMAVAATLTAATVAARGQRDHP